MENLTDNKKPKGDYREKLVAWGVPIAGVIALYKIMPFLLGFLSDVLTAAAYSVAILTLLGIVGVIATVLIANWTEFKIKYMTWAKRWGKILIKSDPIAFMRGAYAIWQKKFENLGQIITELLAGLKVMERERDEMATEAASKFKLAAQMQKNGDEEDAANEAAMAKDMEVTVTKMYDPLLKRGYEQRATLMELQENWGRALKRLDFTIKHKEREFKMLKQFAAAYGAAEDFANENTVVNRIYNDSLQALEEKVGGYLSTIEEFERATAPKRKAMAAEKQMLNADGLAALEAFTKTGKLSITEDFSGSQLDLDKLDNKDMFAKIDVKVKANKNGNGKKAPSAFQSQNHSQFTKSTSNNGNSNNEFDQFLNK